MLILLLILYDPTTLVYPPFSHTLGYHKGTISQLILATGKPIDKLKISGISAVKIKSLDDPTTTEDDDELSLFVSELLSNSIYYNLGLTNLGMFKSPVIGDSALWNPSDCEITPAGTLWVVDQFDNRVVKFYFDGKNLNYINSFGRFGLLPGCFDDPRQIAVTPKKVYVSDYGNNRIQVFDHNGKFLEEIGGFHYPIGIEAVSGNERWLRYRKPFILVIDSSGTRLTKLSQEGRVISVVTKEDLEYPHINFESIAVDYYGLIWVTDSYNHCIHLFDQNLDYIVKYGQKGVGDKKFIKPKGITIWRRYGQVFVVDSMSIQYFWMGVDAWIRGIAPGIFKPREGVTVSFYLTQPADLTVNIYDSEGREIRILEFGRMEKPGKNYILWDTLDEMGKPVGEGEYKIELVFEPTYSSRGRFQKKISAEVLCKL